MQIVDKIYIRMYVIIIAMAHVSCLELAPRPTWTANATNDQIRANPVSSDLTMHLNCCHLTELYLKVANSELEAEGLGSSPGNALRVEDRHTSACLSVAKP